ncbi:hypothetical protein WICMUC_001378 [Wickerhamomyces mucosus]|uniref:Enoyl reductase (ER) domain-containing protein n=1 Tax=Wickerhamomyces mucosus TaxID=1378264 RepID=A0A9P8PWJ2_9ASCO|nr:hypothetical protein WICMUC_001378 [Wickerhamomyces mucosus]
MTQIQITQSNFPSLKNSISDSNLKRKLQDIYESKDGHENLDGKQIYLEKRTLSVSSTDSEDLESKLDSKNISSQESESESESDNDRQPLKKRRVIDESIKEEETITDTQETLKESEQELTSTEQHLIENDDENLQSAVVIKSFDEPFQIEKSYPIPDLNEHEVLVENKFIGLNPIDWKGHKYRFGVYSFPWIQGRESSGIVSKVGSKVENLNKGDKVFIASTSYRDLRTSTFQKFTIFDSRLVWKLPENISLKQGSALGVGLVTAGSVLEELNTNIFANNDNDETTDEKTEIDNDKNNETTTTNENKYLKKEDRKSILIWGGSSGVGGYVIQLAKIAGFEKIIAVASNKHKDHLFNIGATHHLDRFKSIDELSKELLEIVPDGLQIGVDVVGKETSNHVIDFLNLNNKGDNVKNKTFVGVVSKPSKEKDLSNITTKEVFIKKFHEDLSHGENLVNSTFKYLTSGELKPQQNFKTYNGFEGIIEGLKDLEKFGASNEKYVVEL